MVKLNNKTVLEVTKNERKYSLECDAASPLGELHDVLVEMKGYVVQRFQDVQDQEKKTEASKEAPVEIEAEDI